LTDRDALADPTIRRQVCHGLLLRLAEVIAGGESSDAAPGRFRSRRLLVHEAEAVMDSRPDGTLTMLELCQELEVSERSLHYAFREILRQTPMAFTNTSASTRCADC
jgi:transcriptional regulator GlxA family with amidase domain